MRFNHSNRFARRVMECGEFSPLFAGDLSPSRCRCADFGLGTPRWRKPRLSSFFAAVRDFDGDESPAESGDKSPHSKARLRQAARCKVFCGSP